MLQVRERDHPPALQAPGLRVLPVQVQVQDQSPVLQVPGLRVLQVQVQDQPPVRDPLPPRKPQASQA